MNSHTGWMLAACLTLSCASQRASSATARTLDRMLASPAAREIAREAPAAYALAVRAVEEARSRGTEASAIEAQLTFELAQAQAMLVVARRRIESAERERASLERDTSRAEQAAASLEAETEQLRVARRAGERARQAATSPTSVPSAERMAMAAEVRQQAALVLAAAAMLGANEAQSRNARERIAEAERVATGADANAAVRAAGVALHAAERTLREVREGGTPTAAIDGVEIATNLSMAGGFEPRRDARGVVVVLHGLFEGPRLAATARTRIETLARMIRAREGARVRVEVFVGGPVRSAAEALATHRAQGVRDALRREGVPDDRLQAQGLYRLATGARTRDRVEVVLVLPSDG